MGVLIGDSVAGNVAAIVANSKVPMAKDTGTIGNRKFHVKPSAGGTETPCRSADFASVTFFVPYFKAIV